MPGSVKKSEKSEPSSARLSSAFHCDAVREISIGLSSATALRRRCETVAAGPKMELRPSQLVRVRLLREGREARVKEASMMEVKPSRWSELRCRRSARPCVMEVEMARLKRSGRTTSCVGGGQRGRKSLRDGAHEVQSLKIGKRSKKSR
jgi:hypothetical protein